LIDCLLRKEILVSAKSVIAIASRAREMIVGSSAERVLFSMAVERGRSMKAGNLLQGTRFFGIVGL
jgi:hypothetical protein